MSFSWEVNLARLLLGEVFEKFMGKKDWSNAVSGFDDLEPWRFVVDPDGLISLVNSVVADD